METGDGRMSRREAIFACVGGTGIYGAAIAATGWSGALAADAPTTPAAVGPPRRALRFAHLTDIHVQPELHAEEGLAKCLEHVQSLDVKPDLILTGGDHVMDAFEQAAPRATLVRKLWRECVRQGCSLRVESAIGNHDIWGWHSRAKLTGTEPEFGKAFALDMLGLSNRYRSFDAGGWHFVVLDSIQRRPDTYVCEIDDEQFAWLEQDLATSRGGRPTVVLSHAPIITVTVASSGDRRKNDTLVLSGGLQHLDGPRVHALLRRHDVKLCLSGHIHLLDRCTVDGVTYVCDGAVCGAWWKGANKGVPEGYGVVDLYDDGSFEHRYQPYGWVAIP